MPARAGKRRTADRGGSADSLSRYREKRNVRRSGEPSARRGRGSRKRPRFVVQQHDATGMHYDFRLESGGVLKSWAVPKGPSDDPDDKRLAMPTEDHPLGYAGFEGVIPDGEYGAGPVIVWDSGTYQNETTDSSGEPVDVGEAIEHGHLRFRLDGQKLRGSWSLTRMGGGGRERWLLVKVADQYAAGRSRARKGGYGAGSVESGKTIEEMAAGRGGAG
jgi:DNA ligase D-like protein (predicted 3'-phosphoesterase)